MKVKATNHCFQRNYWIVVSKSKSFLLEMGTTPGLSMQFNEHLQHTAKHMTFNHSALYRKHHTFLFFLLSASLLFSFFLSPSHASQLESEGGREAKSKADLSVNHSSYMECVSVFPHLYARLRSTGNPALNQAVTHFSSLFLGRRASSGNRHYFPSFHVQRCALMTADA